MKSFEIKVDKFQAGWIFAPIRERGDIIGLLMKIIKIILINSPPPENMIAGSIVLRIEKMSRLFFISEEKIFSVNMPFLVEQKDGALRFYTNEGYDIDNKLTSEVLELLSSSMMNCSSILEFADPICEIEGRSPEIWKLFRNLMIWEDGYLRYDLDEKRANGHIHPINHLDIFYSSGATFKIGLAGGINHETLEDILNAETECHYLNRWNEIGKK